MDFLDDLKSKYEHQPTFLQAVEEMALSLKPLFEGEKGDYYKRAFVAIAEPERTLKFRVSWMDDAGKLQFNRGWRIEFNSVLGPYKGGLRFHPTANEGILKFLGFEQIFKNALTGLAMGGGKGGSDFNPKGKSDAEVIRFCQSFMTELAPYLHPSTDVPAGDIGVGGREIGAMYGQYKRLKNKHGEGILTGKGALWGGSPFRPEATGYGLVYIMKIAVEKGLGKSMEGMRCALSGSGNVCQYAAQKCIEFGAKVITVSDSSGCIVFENGMTTEDLAIMIDCKEVKRARLSTLEGSGSFSGKYHAGESPWSLDQKYDLALPCATQNEISGESAARLVKNGVVGVGEGANLPTDMAGQDVFRANNVIYIPGKAANAGGVGVSGLEMAQNAQRLTWKPEEVDNRLKDMMAGIYQQMEDHAPEGGTLEQGANIAGFIKVVQGMKELGWFY